MTETIQNTNSKFFFINRSELSERYDPDMVLYNRKAKSYNYPTIRLKKLLLKNPQYGANESGIERKSYKEPRYIRITDIDEFGLLKDNIGVTAEKIEEKYFLNNNDILFARSGATVGKAYIHRKDNFDYECFFAGYMIRFIVDDSKILPDYLFTYTQLNIYKDWVNAIQRAAGQPNINAEEYKSLLIALPPINIQQQIVAKINNAYIQKLQKETQAQELLKSIDTYLLNELGITLPVNNNSLENRMFTVNFSEVVGSRLDSKFNSEYYKKIFLAFQKSKYPFVKIKNILKAIKTGTTPNEKLDAFTNNEELVFLRNTNLKKYYIDLDDVKYVKNEYKNELTFSEKNEVIMCIAGTVGLSAFNNYELPIAINQNVSSLKFKEEIKPEFASFWFNTELFIDLTKRACSVATIFYLNNDNLKSLPMPLPPIDKQKEIINHINDIQEQIKTLQADAKRILDEAKQEVEKIIIGN